MNFSEAFEAMQKGKKVKLPSWAGYWVWEDDSIKLHCKDGKVIDIRETVDVKYTFSNIISDEWIIAGEENCTLLGGTSLFDFGSALKLVKKGVKITRTGWNGKGMFVVYQKGYPEGIPCNAQTANAWGMKEGDLFKCSPYLQIKCADGSHSMWVPSINDILAEDWEVYKDEQ